MEIWNHPALTSPRSLLGNAHFVLGFFWYFVVRSILNRNSNGVNNGNYSGLFFCPFSWTTPPSVPVIWAKIDGHSPKHHLCSHVVVLPLKGQTWPCFPPDNVSPVLEGRNPVLENHLCLNSPITWGLYISKGILQLQWIGQTCSFLHLGSETHSQVSYRFPKPICLM